MKGNFDAYALWPLDKKVQNQIVDFRVGYVFLVFSIFGWTPPWKASGLQNMQLRFEEFIEQNRIQNDLIPVPRIAAQIEQELFQQSISIST